MTAIEIMMKCGWSKEEASQRSGHVIPCKPSRREIECERKKDELKKLYHCHIGNFFNVGYWSDINEAAQREADAFITADFGMIFTSNWEPRYRV